MDNITIIQNYLSYSGRDMMLQEVMMNVSDSDIADVVESTFRMEEADWPEWAVRNAVITELDTLLHKTRDVQHFAGIAI